MPNLLIRHMKRLAMASVILLAAGNFAAAQDSPAAPYDRSAAVIIAYERVGDPLNPASSISTEQFASHVRELVEGGYHIAPLPAVVNALKAGTPLPDKTVSITFNGGYQSALDNAVPLLLEKNLPFTVFFSSDMADSDTPEYMGWDDIRRLRKHSLVTVGLHPASYARIATSPAEEIRRQVNNALVRFRHMTKSEPTLFAYPFGEYTKTFRDIVAAAGFDAAFGQHSGAAGSGADMFALPRFIMTDRYGDDARFHMAVLSLPLPVKDITPEDPFIRAGQPLTLGFTLDSSLADRIRQLSCFVSGREKPDMQVVGHNRVELRVPGPFVRGRVRVNCTIPGPVAKPGEDQRWRWFGMLLSVESPAGEPDEAYEDEHYQDGEISAGPYPN